MKKIIAASILASFVSALAAQSLSYADVLGKVFISSAGSSGGTFLMSASVKVEGRNNVSVGFVGGGITWSDPSIAAVESSREPTDVTYAMLNCKNKTYTPTPKVEDGYTLKEFNAGSKYKWGDYSGGELLTIMTNEHKNLTKYFGKVCQYTAQ